MGGEGIVQYLSAVSGADGSFHFDRVRLDNDIELVWWGEGVSEGRKKQMEKLPAAERQAIRIENAKPGAMAGKINRQTFPNLADIGIIHQGGGGGMHDIRFDEQPDKADYDFRNLTPGEYILTIRVDAPRGKSGRGWAKVAESMSGYGRGRQDDDA